MVGLQQQQRWQWWWGDISIDFFGDMFYMVNFDYLFLFFKNKRSKK
jgi:hypothetical protein